MDHFSESLCTLSPMCVCVATFWEVFVTLVVSHFGFDGRALVLIASVPGHCLPIAILKVGQLTGNDECIHIFF